MIILGGFQQEKTNNKNKKNNNINGIVIDMNNNDKNIRNSRENNINKKRRPGGADGGRHRPARQDLGERLLTSAHVGAAPAPLGRVRLTDRPDHPGLVF